MRRIDTPTVFLAAASFAAVALAAPGTQTVTLSSPAIVGDYTVKNADRGAVKRLKVFREGRLIATITLRRGEASAYCCAAEACHKLDASAACTTLKVTCDADGLCSAG